ncbi:hypothetical protein N9N67_01680 [Bacteriovoracaceae bacterium]|nr:hypothetical protein [Bacteriovoracaceae bacterium]
MFLRIVLLFIFLLKMNPLIAEDAFINLCCPQESQPALKKDLALILIKNKDQYSEEEGCFKIFTTEKREKIISALTRMKHPQCQLDSTLSPKHGGPQCNLEVEQVSRSKNSQQQIGFENPRIILNKGSFKHKGNSLYQISTMNNKSASIQLGHNQIKVHCQVDTNQMNYGLKVSVRSLTNQQLNSTETSLTLSKGQKREISHLFNQGNSSSRNIDLSRGVLFKTNQHQSEYQYFIYVKP